MGGTVSISSGLFAKENSIALKTSPIGRDEK